MSNINNLNGIMTVGELAEYMRISLPTAYKLTQTPGFPVLNVGKKKLIVTGALQHWIEEEVKQNERQSHDV